MHRALFHADVHLNKHVRGFIQLANHNVFDKANAITMVEENQLDLQQAFAELSMSLKDVNLSLRAGRQEMRFGSDRLVSVRNNPNVWRSFDAARLSIKTKDFDIDTFYALPLELRGGVFDDRDDDNQHFWGIYAASNKPLLAQSDAKIDIYYLGIDRESAIFTQGTADEYRHTLGTRVWNKTNQWDYNFEFAYQFGDFGQSNIRAWTLASDTGYRMSDSVLKPRLGVKFNVISGDDDPSDKTLKTFNALFPNLTYFSENALIVPANLFNVHPSINLQVTPNLDFTAGWDFLWRYNTKDAFYTNPFRPLKGAAQQNQRYTGSELNLDLNWQLNRNLQLSTSYVHFFASDLIIAIGGGDVNFLC